MAKYEDLNPIPELRPKWLAKFYSNIKISREEPFCWEWQRQLNVGGYGIIRLGEKQFTVSRVAYKIFNNNEDPGELYVCHRCNNRKCVKKEHLYLDDQIGNISYAHSLGRVNRVGRNNGRAVLHECDVIEIRKLREQGYTLKKLAKKFAVVHSVIASLLNGETWQYVK